jgi:hypothetical protein
VSFSLPEDMKSEKPFIPAYIFEDSKRLIGVAEAENDDNPGIIVATLK